MNHKPERVFLLTDIIYVVILKVGHTRQPEGTKRKIMREFLVILFVLVLFVAIRISGNIAKHSSHKKNNLKRKIAEHICTLSVISLALVLGICAFYFLYRYNMDLYKAVGLKK